MKIFFAAPEHAWAGILGRIKKRLPRYRFDAAGRFHIESLSGYDVLIPVMSQVTREHLETADRLKLVQQCGVGLERIDLVAASELGIPVANVPSDVSGNADSVAELGIFLMVGLSRNILSIEESFRNGKMGQPHGRSLMGRTVGIVGLGGIGRALARRLEPFGVTVIGVKRTDPQKAVKELGLSWVGGADDLPELLKRSDYVVMCLPQTEESKGMIDREALSLMKRDAFLINLSRGGVVDRDALEWALREGEIAGAGLDVFWKEPPDMNDPIFNFNVLATPHIAGSTDVTMDGIVRVVAENIRRVEEDEPPLYVKNL
jgi:phosphoglycerate dehydrogenase-like enzyme